MSITKLSLQNKPEGSLPRFCAVRADPRSPAGHEHSRRDKMTAITRRQFLRSLGIVPGAALLAEYHALAAAEKGKTRIRDIRVMMLQGPRTYTLVKVESDAGLFGIGEAYGSPGVGVK